MKTSIRQRTVYETLLHKNRLTYRRVAREIGCSTEYARLLATGQRAATGEKGDAFLALIETLKSPNRQPSPLADDSLPGQSPLTGQDALSHHGARA